MYSLFSGYSAIAKGMGMGGGGHIANSKTIICPSHVAEHDCMLSLSICEVPFSEVPWVCM